MVNNGLLWLSECTSTNDEANARISDPGIRAVASDHQTAGRGRLGRPWFSPPGSGLYMSWIARPRFSQATRLSNQLPLATFHFQGGSGCQPALALVLQESALLPPARPRGGIAQSAVALDSFASGTFLAVRGRCVSTDPVATAPAVQAFVGPPWGEPQSQLQGVPKFIRGQRTPGPGHD